MPSRGQLVTARSATPAGPWGSPLRATNQAVDAILLEGQATLVELETGSAHPAMTTTRTTPHRLPPR